MGRFRHSFWRYIPSTDERQSFFKFVESFETDSDAVPKFDDHYCIDHIFDTANGQMRVKNHSAPEYCVSKYVGWSLNLPPVEKTNKQEIYMVIHRSSFSHKKIEFDEFVEPKNKRYTQEEWELLLSSIEKKFKRAVTDSENEVRYDREAKPGIANLLDILSAVTGASPQQLADQYTQYGTLKSDCGASEIQRKEFNRL